MTVAIVYPVSIDGLINQASHLNPLAFTEADKIINGERNNISYESCLVAVMLKETQRQAHDLLNASHLKP